VEVTYPEVVQIRREPGGRIEIEVGIELHAVSCCRLHASTPAGPAARRQRRDATREIDRPPRALLDFASLHQKDAGRAGAAVSGPRNGAGGANSFDRLAISRYRICNRRATPRAPAAPLGSRIGRWRGGRSERRPVEERAAVRRSLLKARRECARAAPGSAECPRPRRARPLPI